MGELKKVFRKWRFVYVEMLRCRARRKGGRVGEVICVPVLEVVKGGGSEGVLRKVADRLVRRGSLGGGGSDDKEAGEEKEKEEQGDKEEKVKLVWRTLREIEELESGSLIEPFGDILHIRRSMRSAKGSEWEVREWEGTIGFEELGVFPSEMTDMLRDEEAEKARGTEKRVIGKRRRRGGLIALEDVRETHGNGYDSPWYEVETARTKFGIRNILSDALRSPNEEGQLNVPWFNHGWFEKYEYLFRHGMDEMIQDPLVRSVEQVYCDLSCSVLQGRTAKHRVYMKTVLDGPLITNEPALLSYLNEIIPYYVPELLIHSEQNRSMVVIRPERTFSTQEDEWKGDSAAMWNMCRLSLNAIRALYEFQLWMCFNVRNLHEVGVPVFRSAKFGFLLHELLYDPTIDQLFSEHEAHRLRKYVLPDLRKEVVNLNKADLPITLVHGNMSFRNIAFPPTGKGPPIFSNFQDAYLSHPFLDPACILTPQVQPAYDLYLTEWVRYAAWEKLQDAFHAAKSLRSVVPAVRLLALYKAEGTDCKSAIIDLFRERIRDLGTCYFPRLFPEDGDNERGKKKKKKKVF